jgi:hypothetical protein
VIFDHCMPFDVTRAYDEATQHRDPRIWTAERDVEMWKALENPPRGLPLQATPRRRSSGTAKHLNMEFVLAIAEDHVPSTGAPDPYMHVFLDAGNGNVLAFFELPNSPPMGRDPNTPEWVQHIAFKVASLDRTCWPPRRGCRPRASTWSAPPTTPSSSRSTSSTPTATVWNWPADTATPEMNAKLDAVKWDMLEEWSRTRKAPQHAAWMHPQNQDRH